MLEVRNILLFTPFYFRDSNTYKDKFFVVLKSLDSGGKVLATLPTSKIKIPADRIIDQGCIEMPEGGLTCFVIPPEVDITECGKRFKKSTFIYGYQLRVEETDKLMEAYPIEGTNYQLWGR